MLYSGLLASAIRYEPMYSKMHTLILHTTMQDTNISLHNSNTYVMKTQAYWHPVPDTVDFKLVDFFFSGDNLFLGAIFTSLSVSILSARVI